MHPNRLEMRRVRLDRINAALKDHGFRVHHNAITLTGKGSCRPYVLLHVDGTYVGRFQFAETAQAKALRMLGK